MGGNPFKKNNGKTESVESIGPVLKEQVKNREAEKLSAKAKKEESEAIKTKATKNASIKKTVGVFSSNEEDTKAKKKKTVLGRSK